MPRSSPDEEVEFQIDTSDSINSLPAELKPTTEDDETQEEQEEPTIVAGQRRDTNHRGVLPYTKRSKTSGIEKALSSITETFAKHQLEMEEKMQKAEERMEKFEMETMERIRREDGEHELGLFQMLGQLMGTSGPQYYVPPLPPAHPSAMPFTSMSPPPRPPDHTDNTM